jgi:hypothetical protein
MSFTNPTQRNWKVLGPVNLKVKQWAHCNHASYRSGNHRRLSDSVVVFSNCSCGTRTRCSILRYGLQHGVSSAKKMGPYTLSQITPHQMLTMRLAPFKSMSHRVFMPHNMMLWAFTLPLTQNVASAVNSHLFQNFMSNSICSHMMLANTILILCTYSDYCISNSSYDYTCNRWALYHFLHHFNNVLILSSPNSFNGNWNCLLLADKTF